MEAYHPNEQKDIENFKKVLRGIVKEETKTVSKLVPVTKAPKPTAEDKAAQKIAKKTAEAQTKDAVKVEELQEILREAIEQGDQEGIDNVISRLAKLQNRTVYPPKTVVEDLTQLPVKAVSRGEQKSPLVEAVVHLS